MQPGLEVINLALRKPGSVASHSLVSKPCDAFGAVVATPFHKSNPAAPGDGCNLLCGVASAVEPDRLIASARGAVFAATIGIVEFPDLVFR